MKTIIIDIDNTIADISHRLKYIINEDGSQKEKKDWDKFFSEEEMDKDKPREEVIKILKELGSDYRWVFVTGRPKRTFAATCNFITSDVVWYRMAYSDNERELRMRPEGDRRNDDILKKELTKDLKNVAYIFEDRPRVIKMYREQFPHAIIIDTGNGEHFKEER